MGANIGSTVTALLAGTVANIKGNIFIEILIHLERVSDHCNIAEYMRDLQ